MKKVLIGLAFIAVLAASAYFLRPRPAACAWCNPGPCYNAGVCGYQCRCLKFGNEQMGRCVSF